MVIMAVIGIILFIVIFVLYCKSQSDPTPKDGYETDYKAAMHDSNSGKSKYEIRGKYYSGGYNVPKNKHK